MTVSDNELKTRQVDLLAMQNDAGNRYMKMKQCIILGHEMHLSPPPFSCYKSEIMKEIKYFFVIIAIILSGCATTHTSIENITSEKPILSHSQKEVWNLMIGNWYGSQPTKDGGKKLEIMERASNGTYKLTFRIYNKNGYYNEQTEVGYWGVSGTVYFTIFRGWVKGVKFSRANSSDPYNYDAYKIINLTDEIFEYEHFSTGNKYTNKKVSKWFDFPK